MAAFFVSSRHVEQSVMLTVGLALAIGFVWSQRPQPLATPHKADAVTGQHLEFGRSQSLVIPVLADSVGTVRSRRQTEVASRLLAEVRRLTKNPGDRVSQGEVIAVLDARDLVARVSRLEATRAAKRQALDEARTELERTRNLHAKEAATNQQLELANFRFERVTAELDAADRALEEAQIQRSYAEVKAPFDGQVFRRDVDPGDLATPGRALLGVFDPEQLRLEVRVEESLMWRLLVGDVLAVRVDALRRDFVGRVSEVVPAVDPATRTGIVKIDLPTSADLRPGMYGRARIRIGERDATIVPETAIVRHGQLEFIFAVESIDDERRVRLMLVRTGSALDRDGMHFLEVLSGLDAGVDIVVQGAQGLRDGAQIQ